MSSLTSASLTDEQRDAIISEALNGGMFERTVDGGLPEGDQLTKAAQELVRQARLSVRAGNRNPKVLSLLYIAEDDLVSAQPNRDIEGRTDMATAEAQVDLSAHPLEALRKFEETLLGYPQDNEEVQQNLALVRAEIAKKGGPAVAVAQPAPDATPAPVVETAQVSEPQNGADRKALVDRLTFSMMRTHGIDPSEVDGLSDSQLQWIIEHPGGAGESQPAPAPVAPPAPPVAQEAPADLDGQTTVMVINREPESIAPTPAAAEEAAPKSDIDPEREELESQITGPILKSYGRGRVDVPGIGINELRFMIQNPEGRVTAEQLAAAKALDEGSVTEEEATERQIDAAVEGPVEPIAEQAPEQPEMVVTKEVLGPEQVDHFLPPAEPEVSAEDQAEKVATSQRMTKAQAFGKEPPANPAQEIIDREQFPTPPEIDGRPPRLPFDMSKLDDDSLRSLHAQMHAVHSRANYIVGIWEGELRDIVKLRKGEEVTAANNAPTKDPDDSRKRLTDAQREALVAANPEVVRLKEEEHQIERILRQLRTLRDGYSSDVSTCSRQWAMRKDESNGVVAR